MIPKDYSLSRNLTASTVAALCLIIFHGCMATANDVGGIADLTVTRCDNPPTIDGDLKDRCWKKAAQTGPFSNFMPNEALTQKTIAYLTYDDNNLYIAFQCFESKPGGIVATKTQRDSYVWDDDSVEVFLDTNLDRKTYYHFIVNTLNAQYDEFGHKNPRWNGQWRSGVKIHKDYWVAELAIPFKILKTESDTWGVNFTRERRGQPSESSTWSALRNSFHKPEEFKTIDGLDVSFYASLKLGEATIGNLVGTNQAQVQVENKADDRKLILKLTVTEPKGKTTEHTQAVDVPSGAQATLSAGYLLSEPGLHKFVLDIVDVAASRSIYEISLKRRVPQLLGLVLPTSIYYEDDDSIAAEIMVNAADDLRAKLQMEIKVADDKGNTVSQKTLPAPKQKEFLDYDISGLGRGKYLFEVKLIRDGNTAASAEKEFEKIEGFW